MPWSKNQSLEIDSSPVALCSDTRGIEPEDEALRRNDLKLHLAFEAVEAACSAESDFLNDISHNIRTFLNSILVMSDRALGTALMPEQRENIEAIKIAADSLLLLADNIRDSFSIQAHKRVLQKTDFSLRDMVVVPLVAQAQPIGLESSCRHLAHVAGVLIGDPERLRRVLRSLAGNAIKFAEPEDVIVSVGADQQSLASVSLHIAAADTGIGKVKARARKKKNRHKILLAEDHRLIQVLVTRMLERRGYLVRAAANGREALEALERERFDLLIMDLQMPEMSGLEAAASIRSKEKTCGGHVPIIAMTADDDGNSCLAAGMDAYLSKPVDGEELFETIRNLIQESGRTFE